jgi:rhodanese-related sulfurtransferase
MRLSAVRRLLTGLLILFVLALVLGVGFNAVNPVGERLPLVPAYALHTPYRVITLERAAEIFLAQKFYLWRTWGGGPVLFLDARARLEWQDHRIPGAMLMYPLSYVEWSCNQKTGRCREERNDYFGRVLYPYTPAFKDKNLPLIVYGRTLFYNLAAELAWRLHERGHKNIRLMEASLADWRAAGLPIYGPQLTGPR